MSVSLSSRRTVLLPGCKRYYLVIHCLLRNILDTLPSCYCTSRLNLFHSTWATLQLFRTARLYHVAYVDCVRRASSYLVPLECRLSNRGRSLVWLLRTSRYRTLKNTSHIQTLIRRVDVPHCLADTFEISKIGVTELLYYSQFPSRLITRLTIETHNALATCESSRSVLRFGSRFGCDVLPRNPIKPRPQFNRNFSHKRNQT